MHQSQTTNHDLLTHLSKVFFPKRSAKMTDSSEKRKHQLAFELQSSRVLKSAVESQRHYFCGFDNILFWNFPRWKRYATMTIDEETHVVLENTCKESPGCSALLMDQKFVFWPMRSRQFIYFGKRRGSVAVEWNARNSYGYTYVYS